MTKRILSSRSNLRLLFWLVVSAHLTPFAPAQAVTDDQRNEDVEILEETIAAPENPEYSELNEILDRIPRALLAAQRLKRYQDKIDLLLYAAKLHERKGETVKAENYWISALKLASERKPNANTGNIYTAFAQFLREHGRAQEAIEQLQLAEQTFYRARETALSISTKQKIAFVQAEEGQSSEAISTIEAVLFSAIARDDPTDIGKAYQAKAMVEMILGKTLQLDLGDFVIGKTQLIHHQGSSISEEEEDYNNHALESLQTAMSYFENAGDDMSRANCLRLKGDIMLHLHKLKIARGDQQEAYRLFASVGKCENFLQLQISIAIRQTMDQKIDSALRTINAAISSNEEEINKPWLQFVRAEILLKDFNDPEAGKALREGLKIAEEYRRLDQLIALNQLLAIVEINLGNYQMAFAALEQATQSKIQQISIEKEQIEKARDRDLEQLENAISSQVSARTNLLENRLYGYEAMVRNAWIIGITLVLCFVGLLLMASRHQTEKQRKLDKAKADLIEANETLKQTGDMRNALFESFVQELKTPMNGIVGAIPLISDDELSPLQENAANIIDISSRSITTLINDISDLSRIESGDFHLEKTEFSIVHLLESVVQLLQADSTHSDVDIHCEVPSDPVCKLYGDVSRIQQVLIAIIGHALQSTDEGFVSIKLEGITTSSEQESSFHLTVEDTGAKPDLENVESFFEINPKTNDSGAPLRPASMIGMSITKKLVDAMEGSIKVSESDLGGTRFDLLLPFTVEDESGTWVAESTFERFPRKRALIIDASEPSAKILGKHLRAWELQFESVEDINSASSLLERPHGFDVIFLDGSNSEAELNLLEQISVIRSFAVAADTPILLLSGFSNLNNSLELKRTKYIHQVSKPFRIEQLHTALNQALHFKSPVSKSYAKLTPELERSDRKDGAAGPKPKESNGFQFMPYILPTRSDIRVDPNLKVLLAEDNVVNQKVTMLMLNKMGYDVKVVPNGRKAVEAVESGQFNVVLMDKIMPIMDGLEACREIRKLQSIDQPIIIALAASATMEDEIACQKATMDNFLTKPVQLGKMKAALGFATRVLEERKQEKTENLSEQSVTTTKESSPVPIGREEENPDNSATETIGGDIELEHVESEAEDTLSDEEDDSAVNGSDDLDIQSKESDLEPESAQENTDIPQMDDEELEKTQSEAPAEAFTTDSSDDANPLKLKRDEAETNDQSLESDENTISDFRSDDEDEDIGWEEDNKQ